ncbi:MAG TPA: alpha/beta hydrolase [Actinomycetes bacterium]
MAAILSARHRLRRTVPALLAAGLAAALLGVPAAAPAASAGGAPVPHLSWSDCGDGFQCATALVPLDYDDPGGQKISLALIRRPASDPAHRIGSLFLNPGGPGGSGVDFVRALGDVLFSDEVRARFDLVGFDPRGIIRSAPLRCFDSLDDALAVLAPMAFPVTRDEERVWVESDRKLADACAARGGAIRDHMATADAARDLDLLRQAVGDRKLTYVGYSYGTYLGATYANLFPGKVRSLVVDGVLDPIAWSTGRGRQARTQPFSTRLRSDQGAYATLRQFFTLCNHGGDNCAFSEGDPRLRYRKLARRLLAEPAQLPDGQGGTQPFTYADLVATTLGAMYSPESWADLAQFLQQLDELTRPQAAAASLRSLRRELGAYQADYENFVEGGPGVFCTDSDNPASVGAWARAARASDRRFPYFGRLWTWISSICQPWPGHDADRYMGPFTEATSNPVLVVGNRFDPATRYQGAVTLAGLLPRSRLLTLAGWGHTTLFESACIDGHVSRYLLSSLVPAAGTVCQPDTVPFTQPAAAAALASRRAADRALVVPAALRRAIAG